MIYVEVKGQRLFQRGFAEKGNVPGEVLTTVRNASST